MDIQISDKRIQEIAEAQIKTKVNQRVGEVLNSEYWQTMSQRIDNAVLSIVNERITDSVIQRVLDKLDREKIKKLVADAIARELLDKAFDS